MPARPAASAPGGRATLTRFPHSSRCRGGQAAGGPPREGPQESTRPRAGRPRLPLRCSPQLSSSSRRLLRPRGARAQLDEGPRTSAPLSVCETYQDDLTALLATAGDSNCPCPPRARAPRPRRGRGRAAAATASLGPLRPRRRVPRRERKPLPPPQRGGQGDAAVRPPSPAKPRDGIGQCGRAAKTRGEHQPCGCMPGAARLPPRHVRARAGARRRPRGQAAAPGSLGVEGPASPLTSAPLRPWTGSGPSSGRGTRPRLRGPPEPDPRFPRLPRFSRGPRHPRRGKRCIRVARTQPGRPPDDDRPEARARARRIGAGRGSPNRGS
jgi:hypothetical protein